MGYFLNTPSSKLDRMRSQHPLLEECNRIHYPAEKPPNKISSLESSYARDLKSHLGMINPACLSPL